MQNQGKNIINSENFFQILTIFQANLTQKDEHSAIIFTGSGFLYRMVRMLVGSLVMLAYGKIDKDFLQQRLQLKNLTSPLLIAPARGLFLEKIDYEI